LTQSSQRTGTLHWTEQGPTDQRGLVLLHSLGSDSDMWTPQLQAFATVRRVVAIDLPGHGRSTAHPGEYSLDDLGADMLAIADGAGLSRFDICGISLGGLLGLWLTINAPDRVQALIASNTAARVGSRGLWAARIRAVIDQGMAEVRPSVLARFFTPDFGQRRPEVLRQVEETFISVDPVGYIGCCAALRDADLSAAIPAIRCPTLIMAGEEDQATPPDQAEWLHRQILHSRLEMIPHAAHLANLEQPEIFTRLAMDFLQSSGEVPRLA
jgi:3-oxoadipate enol-lactonase